MIMIRFLEGMKIRQFAFEVSWPLAVSTLAFGNWDLFLFLWICEIHSDFLVASCKPYITFLSIVHTTTYKKVKMEKIIFLDEMWLMYTKKSRHGLYTNYILSQVLRELNGSKVLLLQHFKLQKDILRPKKYLHKAQYIE